MKYLGRNLRKHLDVPWPTLPWSCPGCGERFYDHDGTVATAGPSTFSGAQARQATPAEKQKATFLCVPCDFKEHYAAHRRS